MAAAPVRPPRSSCNAVSIPHEVHRSPSDALRLAMAAVSVEASLVRPVRLAVHFAYGSHPLTEPANATSVICVALWPESSSTRAVSLLLTEASSYVFIFLDASKTITMSWGCRQGQAAAAARDRNASMAGNCVAPCVRELLAVLTLLSVLRRVAASRPLPA